MIAVLLACASPAVDTPAVARGNAPTHAVSADELREALEASQITELRWGFSPGDDPAAAADYAPLFAWLGDQVGVPITLVPAASSAELSTLVLRHDVHFAIMAAYAYVRAHERDQDVVAFGTHVANGSLTYGSYIVAHERGPVQTMEDLRGARIGFVEPQSTSGWLFPAARLLDAGVHPLAAIDHTFFGSQDAVIDAILAGAVDAGAVHESALARGRARDPEAASLQIVAKTPRIPNDAYVATPLAPPVVRRAVVHALEGISTRTAEGRLVLRTLPEVNAFVAVDDAHFDIVREVALRVSAQLGPAGEPPQLAPTTAPFDPTAASVDPTDASVDPAWQDPAAL